mmetsp:Transcript_123524/g.227589  ORF Transcript_123524/g.227589 Transcript_123524/m.227589 type:complete len:308 (-) Transcript_123524:866-1789(-)
MFTYLLIVLVGHPVRGKFFLLLKTFLQLLNLLLHFRVLLFPSADFGKLLQSIESHQLQHLEKLSSLLLRKHVGCLLAALLRLGLQGLQLLRILRLDSLDSLLVVELEAFTLELGHFLAYLLLLLEPLPLLLQLFLQLGSLCVLFLELLLQLLLHLSFPLCFTLQCLHLCLQLLLFLLCLLLIVFVLLLQPLPLLLLRRLNFLKLQIMLLFLQSLFLLLPLPKSLELFLLLLHVLFVLLLDIFLRLFFGCFPSFSLLFELPLQFRLLFCFLALHFCHLLLVPPLLLFSACVGLLHALPLHGQALSQTL